MPPKSLQKRKQGEDTQKNSMPFALVGCVQKKKPPAKVSDACQKPPKEKAGRGCPKKQHAIRLSRMRPKKNSPAKVSDASQKPPKEKAGRRYSKKNSMPFALVGCVQKKNPPAKVSDASQKPPKEKAGRRYSKKNSMPFALVGCVQKKRIHLLRRVMPPKSLQKRKQGEDTQKKQHAIRLSRMRPKKKPPAKVNDASCVLKKPPKRGGYPKSRMPIALVGCAQKPHLLR